MKFNEMVELVPNVYTNSERIRVLESDDAIPDLTYLDLEINSEVRINNMDIMNISSLVILSNKNMNMLYLCREQDTHEVAIDIDNKYLIISEDPDTGDIFTIEMVDYQKEVFREGNLDVQYPKYSINIEEEIINEKLKAYIGTISIISSKYDIPELIYKNILVSREELLFNLQQTISNLDTISYLFTEYGSYNYIVYNNKLFKVKGKLDGGLSCDFIDSDLNMFNINIPYSQFYHNNPIILNDSSIVINGNSIIQDGINIGPIDILEGLFKSNYNEGLIPKLGYLILELQQSLSNEEFDINTFVLKYNEAQDIFKTIKDIDIFSKLGLGDDDIIVSLNLNNTLSMSKNSLLAEEEYLNTLSEKAKERM